jgi:hypothetical protein
LLGLAASRHRAIASRPFAATSRSDEPSRFPLHQRRSVGMMRDRLAGGKSQRASRLGHGRPSQGHLMRSGRPNVVTAAVIPRSSTTCCPPSLARPWCPQQPAARTSLSGRSQRCEVPLALRSLLAPEHDRRGGNRPVRAGAGVGARSFAYFSIA